jgi:ribosomal protein S18 acetylase RimI-like enzyme
MILNASDWQVVEAAVRIHVASFTGFECAPTRMFIHKFQTEGKVFGEIENDVLKGYAIVLESPGPHPFLWEIAVADGFRRQGVAGRLIDEIIEWAREQRDFGVELTVKADNAGAIALYENKGFKVTKRMKRYYLDGDGILMRREI